MRPKPKLFFFSPFPSLSLSLSQCFHISLSFPLAFSCTREYNSTPFELGNYRLTTHQVNPLPTHSNLLMKFSPLTDWLAWLGGCLAGRHSGRSVKRPERRRDRERSEKKERDMALHLSPAHPPRMLPRRETEISRAPKWLKASLPLFSQHPLQLNYIGV